jgi:hypothetical protein
MKKNILLVLTLCIAGGVFAQEYTIYLGGDLKGFVTVQKEHNGKITIVPSVSEGRVWIGNSICPLLPEDGFTIWKTTKSIVIDRNTTTTVTSADGKWNRTVIDGNTTTYTTSDGYWTKTVTDGNTITFTSSSGRLAITVLEGNTLTKTYPNETLTITHWDFKDGSRTSTDSYENWWQRIVVSGNTMTETDSSGSWSRAVINGNTTTVTKDGKLSYEEVIRGNTRTFTHGGGGYGYIEVVEENTITITSLDGKRKEVIDKQGNDIFLTLTGAYCFDDIGVSEKDRVQSTINGITSGRLKDGKFYELIDYGR